MQPSKRRRPSNYTILGYALGLLVSIAPHSYFIFEMSRISNIAIVSNSFVLNQIATHSVANGRIIENRFIFYAQNYGSNPSSLLFIVYICFCIYLLRTLKGRGTQRKAILIGLVVAFFPSIYNFIQFLYFTSAVNIPIPILFITGLILMRKIPVVITEESVWDETLHQKWFEDPRDRKEESNFVKVPRWYLLFSKLRRLSRNEKPSQIKLETEKIDDEVI